MVIKESLRHFPIGPFLARESSDNLQIKEGIIPKGAIILINVFKLHKNPEIWGPKADQFYPEHFLPDVISKMHPCSYLAFSVGPRNCIGKLDIQILEGTQLIPLFFAGIKYGYLAVKIVLANVLRSYKLSSDLKMEDVKIKVNCMLKIANENPLRIENRDW